MKKRKIAALSAFIIFVASAVAIIIYHNYNFNSKKLVSQYSSSQTENVKPIKKLPEPDFSERTFNGFNLIQNNKAIPVLMYHSIDYQEGNELRVPKEKFREQMQYLKDNEYTTLSLDEAFDFFKNNKPIPKKSVVITFDDGYEDNYVNAYPILKEFGQRAVIFVISSTVDHGSLTSDQLKEMQKNGIDIQSHTVNHDQLDILSYDKQYKTLKDSRESLEIILNKKVKYISYPFGKYNKNTFKAAKDAGYEMAFTTKGGFSQINNGIMQLNRLRINASMSIAQFKASTSNTGVN